jgi:hypothetical protein
MKHVNILCPEKVLEEEHPFLLLLTDGYVSYRPDSTYARFKDKATFHMLFRIAVHCSLTHAPLIVGAISGIGLTVPHRHELYRPCRQEPFPTPGKSFGLTRSRSHSTGEFIDRRILPS